MKEVLSENNIKYMYVDICESVGKLKQFLKIRDTADACKEIREQHRAGIPCIVIDYEVIPDAAAIVFAEISLRLNSFLFTLPFSFRQRKAGIRFRSN